MPGMLWDLFLVEIFSSSYLSKISTSLAIGLTNGWFTCTLLSDKTLKCWGDNAAYQLGIDTLGTRTSPVKVNDISDATDISLSSYTTYALLSDGTIKILGI